MSHSHVIHFRRVGEGEKLCHIEARYAIHISKVKAPPLLSMELQGV